ncbi:MAG TPA: hypothetical protein VIY48_00090 [Candidatus Paceibacterota bacterium]
MAIYNVSRSPDTITMDEWYFYSAQIDAQDFAIAEARSSGDDWYVLEVTPRAIFKATVTQTVTTEVM